jgi:hypothetical protein
MKKLMLVFVSFLSCTYDFEKYRPDFSSGGGGQAGGPLAGGGEGLGGQIVAGGGEGGDGGILVGAGPIGGEGGEPLGGEGGSAGDGGTGGVLVGGTGGDGGSGGGCTGGQKECPVGSGNCVNPAPANGCDASTCTACPPYANGSTVCENGTGPCMMMCDDPDYDDCDMNDATGCEAHLPDDPMHCGMCNNPCPSGSCMDGMCENVDLCGSQPVPTTGYAICWDLDSTSLSAGRYGTTTVSIGQPALSGPSDQITTGCVSQQASTANDSTNPDVLCPLTGAVAGNTIYLALKAYDTNSGNPPLPFFAFMCDDQNAANGKCRGIVKLYKFGMLVGTYVHPPAGIFSYHDADLAEPLQLKMTLP